MENNEFKKYLLYNDEFLGAKQVSKLDIIETLNKLNNKNLVMNEQIFPWEIFKLVAYKNNNASNTEFNLSLQIYGISNDGYRSYLHENNLKIINDEIIKLNNSGFIVLQFKK